MSILVHSLSNGSHCVQLPFVAFIQTDIYYFSYSFNLLFYFYTNADLGHSSVQEKKDCFHDGMEMQSKFRLNKNGVHPRVPMTKRIKLN